MIRYDYAISDYIRSTWIDLLNETASIFNVSVALITKLHDNELEFFEVNESLDNPIKKGFITELNGTLYCEEVLEKDDEVYIDDATKYEKWKGNPSLQLGLTSFLGMPLKGPNGEVFGTFCIFDTKPIDIKNKNLFVILKKVLESNLNITQQNSYLQKYEALNNYKNQQISKMSHEIRTPLNSIIGYGRLLKDVEENDINSEKTKKYLENIINSSKYLLELSSNILDITKLDEDRIKLVEGNINLYGFIEEIKGVILNLSEVKDIDIFFNVASEVPINFIGDDTRLKQVFINILNNAIKYSNKGSISFTINAVVKDEVAEFIWEIKDTGIGIPLDKQDKLFVPFERIFGDANIEGSGLGLPIAQKLIGLMGGKIKFESTVGVGTTFTVHTSHRIIKKNFNTAAQYFEVDSNKKILVVDDYDLNRMLLEDTLKASGFSNIESTNNGKDAIELAKNNEYDIIFMDINMPILDGIQTMKIIKSLREIKIVAYTASVQEENISLFLSEGFDAVCSKPFTTESLLKFLT